VNLKWDDVKLFLAVHEAGSLSGAARALKLGQPTLSRRIGELEEAVGEPLFERQTQGTTLTAAGLRLLPAAQGMADWAAEATLSVNRRSHLPEGRVRIAAPPGIAYDMVAPLAAKLRRSHPALRIEVLAGIEMLNLGRGEADLALRTLPPTDDELVCESQVSSPIGVFASTDYAARLPRRPRLDELDWVAWAAPYAELRTNVELQALVPGFQPAFASNDYVVQLAACKAGAGAMLLPTLLHGRRGDGLRKLPIDLDPRAVATLYLVCHKRRRQVPKVRLVIDFIAQAFERLG
jgi:DNA-binding transcriptional LysR family regulator